MSRIENKSGDLESRSRRNNLLFYGMERGQGETNKDCEERLRDLITDQMELANDVEFDRVHRVGSKPDSPIIAKCTFYKDKVAILKAKKKLKGSNIFVGEDFSQGVREVRRKLSTFKKNLKGQDKHVSIVYDHLVVDGKSFFLSEDGKCLVEGRGRRDT